MTRLPDFLVIGAARSGTTALHGFLRQAPQIFMPAEKEPNFFAYEGETLDCRGPGASFINNSITRLEQYQALFASAPPTSVCGEASPLYLFEPRAPKRIHHHVPEARLIVILRNPIEQAFSHFLYAKHMCIEPLGSFSEALQCEEERLAAGWQPLFGYSRFPRYAEQLERYFALFPRERIFIRTFEEFQASPLAVLSDIFTFLGVDPEFRPDTSAKANSGGIPRNKLLHDLLMRPNPLTWPLRFVLPETARRAIRDRFARRNIRSGTALEPDARAILHQRLDDDIRRLATLIEQDVTRWLT